MDYKMKSIKLVIMAWLMFICALEISPLAADAAADASANKFDFKF